MYLAVDEELGLEAGHEPVAERRQAIQLSPGHVPRARCLRRSVAVRPHPERLAENFTHAVLAAGGPRQRVDGVGHRSDGGVAQVGLDRFGVVCVFRARSQPDGYYERTSTPDELGPSKKNKNRNVAGIRLVAYAARHGQKSDKHSQRV